MTSPAEMGDFMAFDESEANATVPGAYSFTFNNIFTQNYAEIKPVIDSISRPLQTYKRRIKDLRSRQNESLAQFVLTGQTPVTQEANAIFKKYGRPMPPQELVAGQGKQLCLDVSMNSAIQEIDEVLGGGAGTPLISLVQQLRMLLEKYKDAGEEVMRLEALLGRKTLTLDKAHQKSSLIMNLPENESYPGLIEAYERYLESVFRESSIEETYSELLAQYKKWQILREIISLQHSLSGDGNPLCQICINEQISHAIVPCGHTFCTTCIMQLNLNCPVCRTTIREKLKLYGF